ncbi:hypothetical protein PATA110616_16285 [Paenibacillus tarimensis]
MHSDCGNSTARDTEPLQLPRKLVRPPVHLAISKASAVMHQRSSSLQPGSLHLQAGVKTGCCGHGPLLNTIRPATEAELLQQPRLLLFRYDLKERYLKLRAFCQLPEHMPEVTRDPDGRPAAEQRFIIGKLHYRLLAAKGGNLYGEVIMRSLMHLVGGDSHSPSGRVQHAVERIIFHYDKGLKELAAAFLAVRHNILQGDIFVLLPLDQPVMHPLHHIQQRIAGFAAYTQRQCINV